VELHHDAVDPLFAVTGSSRQVPNGCRYLAPRWGHEMVEHVDRGLALVVGELVQGIVKVGVDDAVDPFHFVQRRETQLLGALGTFLIPDSFHDQLQQRRDHTVGPCRDRRTLATSFAVGAARAHLLEDGLDEPVFDLYLVGYFRLPVIHSKWRAY